MRELIDSREPYIADAEWEQWLKERQETYPLAQPEQKAVQRHPAYWDVSDNELLSGSFFPDESDF